MSNFEVENVKNIYDKISPHFDVTRQSIWYDVEKFVNKFEKNSFILDAGCGNGKNMYRKDCTFIGGDFCNNFLKMIKAKNHEAIQINIKTIPFKNNCFDYILCIAVIHHIKEKIDRINSIKELIRVTKKHGKILISVWLKHGKYTHGDNYINWNLQKKYNKEEKDIIYKRYYYMFEDNELYLDILKNIPNIMIEDYMGNCNNRFIILTKL